MSNKQDRRAGLEESDTSDAFLDTVAATSAAKTRRTAPNLPLRTLSLAAVAAAVLASGFALMTTSAPASPTQRIDELGERAGVRDVAVESPFVDTTVRLVESDEIAVFVEDDAVPVLRVGSADTGAIAALASLESDRIVALGFIPPSLPDPPERLLVSPVSTALTLGGLHPDVLTANERSYLARLVTLARSEEFPRLVQAVDGTTALGDLGPEAAEALADLAAEVVDSANRSGSTCSPRTEVGERVVLCDDTGQYQNLGTHTVFVIDGVGDVCGTIPAATQSVGREEIDALVTMVSEGKAFDTSLPPQSSFSPGVFDPPESCSGSLKIAVDPEDAGSAASRVAAWRLLVDDAGPLAKFVGAGVDDGVDVYDASLLDGLNLRDDGAMPEPPGRLTLAADFLTNETVANQFGLTAAPTATTVDLSSFIDDVLVGLYS